MKKLLIMIFLLTIIISCGSEAGQKYESCDGEIIYNMEWDAEAYKDDGLGKTWYFWKIPVKVDSDTLFAEYHHDGIHTFISTKLLYDNGYSIENCVQRVHLSKEYEKNWYISGLSAE